MMRLSTPRAAVPCLLALAMATFAHAQQRNQTGANRESPGAARENVLRIPPGDPVLQINMEMPEQMRAGQSYDYQITATNTTDDIVLHDVILVQKTPGTVEVQSARKLEDAEPSDDDAQARSRTSEDRQDRQANRRERRSDRQQDSDNSQLDFSDAKGPGRAAFWNWNWGKQDSDAEDSVPQGEGTWTISKLEPGESRTISLTAISDEVGEFKTCLVVKSFTPALCVTTKFVKPELELVKEAPERASLCERLEYTYFVKNTGSGDAEAFTITDPLQEGIQTIEGKDSLEFEVDGLKAGETRKFVATLQAKTTGNMGSRAVVKLDENTEAQSNKPMTEIQQAELVVDIKGPDTEYIKRPLRYEVTVTNRGNAPALDAQLLLKFPEQAAVAHVTEVSQPEEDRTRAERSRRQGEPTAAASQRDENNRQTRRAAATAQRAERQNAAGESQSQGASRTWKLGTLKANESRKVSIVLRHNQAGMLEQEAIAIFACSLDQQQEKIRTVASHQTELIALPALLLSVVDNADPVRQGDDVTYRITVINQGDAPDRNVQVSAELPQQLQYVGADGPTEAQQQGKTVTFGAIDEIPAGERVEYSLTAKATGEGDILLKTKLESDGHSQTATSEEPTKLFEE